MKCFQDMGAPDSPPGRVALGIALFQDLAVIFFIVLLPVLLDEDEGCARSPYLCLGQGHYFLRRDDHTKPLRGAPTTRRSGQHA